MLKAVLDLGTNTFHLLVAELTIDGAWKKIIHKKITVKLGKGGIDKNFIAPDAFNRGINALEEFRNIIDNYNITDVTAVGTSALREATNGVDFVNQALKKTNIGIRVIDGDEEAALIWKGVVSCADFNKGIGLIMDIGGGSTEFIICDKNAIYWKQSFKLGASFLVEKFKPSDPLLKSEHDGIHEFLHQSLKPLFIACTEFNPSFLIGSAGSFETISSMLSHLKSGRRRSYKRKYREISISDYYELHRILITSTYADRLSMKGLIKMRADMIVTASILLNFVLEEIKFKIMMLSSCSLKEGLIYESMPNRSNISL